MKQFYRITSVIMALSLLLSVGTTVYAQNFQDVETNADGSYNKSVVIEAFQSYINALEIEGYLTDDEESEFVGNFFNSLPSKNDFGLLVIRLDGSGSRQVDTEEVSRECITLLRKKIVETAIEQGAEKEKKGEEEKWFQLNKETLLWGGVALALVLIIVIIILVVRSNKKKKEAFFNNIQSPYTNPTNNGTGEGQTDLIIRRKTNSVLHTQSLDDVVNNGDYMAIDCKEFCNDTAVGKMYIKNSCIMDIYNMYADDLRNPNNPKEDGCMVLGRWVYDEKLDEYAVSLEEVVEPGDDAVFAEYELDFGGKIKVKVNEKLRKLRRETNLQYDLTCWVHSHPGLGVFFSNTDSNLHIMHKHPTHPKFLTAIVIDILTPQQDLGIFTFKHDMSINSKADLKQFYSLEEWYKWAVGSKRNSVIIEEHYNTLENAKSHNNQCCNVQLSNNPIIDMDRIAINQDHEHLYFVHGFSTQQSDQTTSMVDRIENSDTVADNELVGCFMVVTHRSFPTIKNAVVNYLNRIKFVLVYSSSDGMLTTIPVINNDLCADESYYGEQSLEELKIWTRRKR